MPRLESDLDDAQVFQLIPNGYQPARVYECEDMDKDDPSVGRTSQAGAPMCVLNWEITSGEFTGRKIKYDNLMLGGKTKEGKPMPLGNLCSFLHWTGVPWECLRCNTAFNERKAFLIATKQDKDRNPVLKVGSFYCPKCEHPEPKMGYDTADFVGATCGVSVGSKKQEGSDRVNNTVKGYLELKA